MKRVIVTGATGFVGLAVVNELLANHVDVVAVVRSNTTKFDLLPSHNNLKIVECDLADILNLELKIYDKGFDAFYHFAWEGTSGDVRSDYNIQLNNIKYACDAINVAKKLDCQKFIYSGSIMEYEAMKSLDSDSNIPANIYSSAKLVAHMLLEAYADKQKITFISAIISNIYGEGELSARFLNSLLRKLILNEKISCTSGNQLYDFIHVSDASRAFVLLGESGESCQRYYIGSKAPRQLKWFIEEARACVNPDTEIGFGEIPTNGISLSYKEFDMSKIYDELGFEQKVSFKEGITRTANWLKNISPTPVQKLPVFPQSNFTFQPCMLKDSFLITPFYRADQRGYFLKGFERDIFAQNGLDCDISEDFYSVSKRWVIRGMHFQHKYPQDKIVSAISGEVFDVIVDLRVGSETFGKWEGFYLSESNKHMLFVPKGFAHGFLVLSESATVSYKCVGKFLPEHDGGIRWNDESINIKWPIVDSSKVIISDKDQNLPLLNELDLNNLYPFKS